MENTAHYLVTPEMSTPLASFNANDDGGISKKEGRKIIEDNVHALRRLQYMLYAEGKRALLIVLQALDAGGKDGVIRHVLWSMNPQGCTVTSFKKPTAEETARDFLWRVHPHVPKKGSVAIFNRSHYEDVLVVRVHNLVPDSVWQERYAHINAFEKLIADNNTKILKFYLHIDQDEQLSRFKKRLDDSDRHWKISETDYTERYQWDAYTAAFNDALSRCSTPDTPWYVIPANRKWFRNLLVSQIVRETLENMQMTFPEPTVDLAHIRREYHRAEKENNSKENA